MLHFKFLPLTLVFAVSSQSKLILKSANDHSVPVTPQETLKLPLASFTTSNVILTFSSPVVYVVSELVHYLAVGHTLISFVVAAVVAGDLSARLGP